MLTKEQADEIKRLASEAAYEYLNNMIYSRTPDETNAERMNDYIESLVRRSDAQRIKDERDEALEVLRELMLWIENWGCAFHDDPEWPETDAKVRALLTKRGAA